MIELTRRSGETYFLNPLLIETVEATPDTVITLVTGKKLIVRESAADVVRRFNEAVRALGGGAATSAMLGKHASPPEAPQQERSGESTP
ncbi:MAG: flagellar FlbD family protein [Hydrogenibacillus sp.]|nr:flagellar FlbD family protein [Hydrogenibacillus sp.]